VLDLAVTSFTPTPTGFTAVFSKPFVNSDSNPVHLYDAASAGYGPPDVTLVGPSGAVRGSLITEPTNTSFTFVKTNVVPGGTSAGLLAPGSYTVTFVSGSTAFHDTTGALLDGNSDGIAGDNYTTAFTVAAPSGVVVTVPDFARGPDAADAINVPNNSANGIPIALSSGSGVTDAAFVLNYNANLLTITGGTVNAALTGASFTVTTSGSGANAQATIIFHSPTPLASGAVRLGGLVATGAANASYKSKELLHFSSVSVNGGAISAVGDDGVHVVAFLGDTSGDGTYTSADSVLLARVAAGTDSGFAAFPALDPVMIGDLGGNGSITGADDGVKLSNFLNGNTVAQVPHYPGAPSNNPAGPDPALSIPATLGVGTGGTVVVPVNIDDPHPDGSTGLTQAILALTYDPVVFSVAATDVRLGTVTADGSGWKVTSYLDANTGRIGLILSSATPVDASTGGSLVTVTFHLRPGETATATSINLVPTVTVFGRAINTALDDNQGPLTLHTASAESLSGTVTLIPTPTEVVDLNGTAVHAVRDDLLPTETALKSAYRSDGTDTTSRELSAVSIDGGVALVAEGGPQPGSLAGRSAAADATIVEAAVRAVPSLDFAGGPSLDSSPARKGLPLASDNDLSGVRKTSGTDLPVCSTMGATCLDRSSADELFGNPEEPDPSDGE
jgi:hypothetical protein